MLDPDLELEEAVKGFFQRHPNLALDRFRLPAERLTWLVPFRAADTTAMLLRSWPRRDQDWRGMSYFFYLTGDVVLTTEPDRTVVPASSIEREIGRSLWESPWESYVPVRPGPTKRVLKEWQDFRLQWKDCHIDLIARRLVHWLFAALKEAPGLMYGYRAHTTEASTWMRLEPFAEGEPLENGRKIDPWKL